MMDQKEGLKTNLKLFIIMGLTWTIEFIKVIYEHSTRETIAYEWGLALNSINIMLVST